MAEECIVPSYIEAAATSTKKLKPKLRAEKEDDPDCQLFIAHGPALTKVTQRYMIDRLGKKWKACPKVNAPKNQVREMMTKNNCYFLCSISDSICLKHRLRQGVGPTTWNGESPICGSNTTSLQKVVIQLQETTFRLSSRQAQIHKY